MLSRVTLVLCLLALCAPVPALAQSSPFQPLPPAQTIPSDQPDTSTKSSTNTGDNGGLATWQEILIFLGGGVLLFGIGWAIVKDARSVAPAGDEPETVSAAKARREAEHKRRKAQARAAAKRARASRKRNR